MCRLRLGRVEKVQKAWFSVTVLGVQNASLSCCHTALFAGEVVHTMLNPSTMLSLSSQSCLEPHSNVPPAQLLVPMAPQAQDTNHGLLTHCDISDHNFFTFYSHRRITVCSSAPQSATPFLKRKSLSPKVITQCTLVTFEICVYTFKICKMYFCNIISNLCN